MILVWKFEWRLKCFNIECHDAEVSLVCFFLQVLDFRAPIAFEGELVPDTAAYFLVDHHADVVGHVILTDVEDLREILVLFGAPGARQVCLVVPALVGVVTLSIGLVFLY